MSAARLTRRGRIWYGYVYEDGVRVQRSTKCTDRRAAEAVVAGWERDAADPARAAANRTTLSDALTLLLNERAEQAEAGRRSQATVKFYRQKAGHLVRLFETTPRASPSPSACARSTPARSTTTSASGAKRARAKARLRKS